MRQLTFALGFILACACMVASAADPQLGDATFYPSAQHPVGYRGDGSGRYSGTSDPTVAWMSTGDAEQGRYQNKNILWKTELNGYTESTPIVVGDKVITLEEPNVVVCLNANTGKVLWRVVCDHLKLLPADKQARAHLLLREIDENYYAFDSLLWEYHWLKGKRPYGPDKMAVPKDQARIQEIEHIWKERGYAGNTPAEALSPGHGSYPYAVGAPEYGTFADALTELQVDFGIAPMLHISSTQMMQHGMTQGTPTSDGKNIFATFASGQTVCFDLKGKTKWMRWYPHALDKTAVRNAFSSPYAGFMKLGFTGMSPLLVDDKLIVTQGYAIRGLWKDTGKLAWEVKYGTGVEAEGERRAFKGPALLTLADGDKVLIFPQGYAIHPSDGKVLSSLTPWDMFDVPSGNVHCAIMGLTTDGDTCYFSWAYGCGAVRVVKTGKDAVEFKHLWRNTIAESAISPGDIEKQPPHGLSAETLIETSPLLDPDRKRLYLSVHERGLWAMDATNGNILAHMVSPHPWNGGPPFSSPSNELVNPMLVGGKYIFSCRESGGTSVYDADDITKVVSENQVYPDITRDMRLWRLSWSELKHHTIDRFFYTGCEWVGGNDDHRTPSDLFIQGDKVYIRSIEGIICVQAPKAIIRGK